MIIIIFLIVGVHYFPVALQLFTSEITKSIFICSSILGTSNYSFYQFGAIQILENNSSAPSPVPSMAIRLEPGLISLINMAWIAVF